MIQPRGIKREQECVEYTLQGVLGNHFKVVLSGLVCLSDSSMLFPNPNSHTVSCINLV